MIFFARNIYSVLKINLLHVVSILQWRRRQISDIIVSDFLRYDVFRREGQQSAHVRRSSNVYRNTG